MRTLTHQIADTLARLCGMETRRCPVNCGLVIRFRGVGKAEAERYREIAADHAGRHRYRS